jgi:hypothetical protein
VLYLPWHETTEVWHQQTKKKEKESQKLEERQERRKRGAARSRAQGRTDSFSKQRDYVGDWQEGWTKVKSGIGQLKQVSESHYRILHILFLYK